MPVFQEGSVNLSSLTVPNVYVQISPPSQVIIGGAPVDILGIVGSAEWGPVNSPVIIGSMADYMFHFGQMKTNKHDAGTVVALAIAQGAHNMRVVRVTDGTDVKATGIVKDTLDAAGLDATAKYSGEIGNKIYIKVTTGSTHTTTTPTYKVIVTREGYTPEVFDNIGGTGNEVWVNMANAINNGQGALREKSELITVVATASTAAPKTTDANYQLAGGSNGIATLDCAALVGLDTFGARTGMYALRETQVSVTVLADCDDDTRWQTIGQFGASEGCYMIVAGAASDWEDILAAIEAKKAALTDNYDLKVMLGDWLLYQDKVNSITRLVSPASVIAGNLVSISPQNSSLNKQLYGFLATESSYAKKRYSSAELEALIAAGMDVITYPAPGGDYFAARVGHNASSNIAIHGDNYTRMTNYLAYSLNNSMGVFISRLQSDAADDELRADVTGAITSWLHELQREKVIDSYQVVCDLSNNPPDQIALGRLTAEVKVRYLAVTEIFLINLEGGQTVITRTTEQ